MNTYLSLRNHYKLEKNCEKIKQIFLQSYSYLSNGMTKRLYLMGIYEKNLIFTSINFNENI